jgi:hypothetical protein
MVFMFHYNFDRGCGLAVTLDWTPGCLGLTWPILYEHRPGLYTFGGNHQTFLRERREL